MTSATSDIIEVKIHEYDKWVTDWSYYVGVESLGKVRNDKTKFVIYKNYH